MNKQTIDHTGLSSIRFNTRERSRAGYVPRGASAHHPIGLPFAYARIPGASPESTTALNAALFLSPFCFSNSERFKRHNIHQQPPQAPGGPKSCSRSLHRSGVSTLNCKACFALFITCAFEDLTAVCFISQREHSLNDRRSLRKHWVPLRHHRLNVTSIGFQDHLRKQLL